MKALICVGGLPYAEATVKFGSVITRQTTSQLTLLKVIDSAGERPFAERMLLEAKTLINRPEAEILVRQGTPAAEIIKESQEGGYDLIILGTHVVQGFLQYFMRSVIDDVTKRASTSVLVVKAKENGLKRILICTGGQDVSIPAVKFGTELAQAAKAEVSLLHVTDPVPKMYTGLETMEESMSALLKTHTPLADHLNWCAKFMREHDVSAELLLRRGIVTEEILLEAEEREYDLIVVGARAESNFWNDLLVGTVIPQILHKSPCSVVVVRA